MNAAVILGAGFSKNSGIPVQSEIPELLLSSEVKDGFENAVSRTLRKFMEGIFGYDGGRYRPEIDDILTCIDISTNSGHHLGIDYPPARLRAVRRFLVYRVFSILEGKFKYSEDVKRLITCLNKRFGDSSYIVLNWDTVLEKYLGDAFPGAVIEYFNGGMPVQPVESDNISSIINVIKIHGSMNWLYCDNCRAIFNDTDNVIPLMARAGFLKTDLELLGQEGTAVNEDGYSKCEVCSLCGNTISSHIATFSYRKSFRSNSFPNLWHKAEETLSNAEKWIFIGYSLPEADYEFKHLLKIAELKLKHTRKNKLEIDVVLDGSDNTVSKYRKFFGSRLNIVCNNGIGEYLNYLNQMV